MFYWFLPPRPHNLLLLLFVFIFCSHSASCWPWSIGAPLRSTADLVSVVSVQQEWCHSLHASGSYSYSHILHYTTTISLYLSISTYLHIYLLDSANQNIQFLHFRSSSPSFNIPVNGWILPRFLPRHSCCSSPLSAASHGIPGHRASRLLSWPPLTVKHGEKRLEVTGLDHTIQDSWGIHGDYK